MTATLSSIPHALRPLRVLSCGPTYYCHARASRWVSFAAPRVLSRKKWLAHVTHSSPALLLPRSSLREHTVCRVLFPCVRHLILPLILQQHLINMYSLLC